MSQKLLYSDPKLTSPALKVRLYTLLGCFCPPLHSVCHTHTWVQLPGVLDREPQGISFWSKQDLYTFRALLACDKSPDVQYPLPIFESCPEGCKDERQKYIHKRSESA